MILQRIKTLAIEVVDLMDHTSRGPAGFMSTGIQSALGISFVGENNGSIRNQSANEQPT